MASGLTREIAEFGYRLRYEELPHEVVDKVKVCTLHGICVGLASVEMKTAQQALRFVKRVFTQGETGTRLLMNGIRAPIVGATFANSVLFHSRIQEDDFHEGLIHLGVIVLPAALAVAEQMRRSGKDFITAVALGYEIGARISQTYASLSVKRGIRSTPLYGPLAAGIASAKLLGLTEEQMINTLGWGANNGGGLLECGIAQTISEMPFQAGFASSAGLMAAFLAQEGVIAAPTLLEGERGFLRAFAGSNEGMEKVTAGLGRDYYMRETFFKLYPVGGILQAPVSAILDLMKKNPIEPLKVQGVEVRMSPVEALYPGVDSMKPGPMNLRYCLSMAICEGKMTTSAIDGVMNECVSNLMSKIKLIPDEGIKPLSCKISVATSDRGSIENQTRFDTMDFNFDEEVELVRSLIPEMKLPGNQVNKAIEIMRNLEACKDMTSLIESLLPS
ncbi:MAG: MmgE/PrpD family protein [Pseudomonadota bacterium]